MRWNNKRIQALLILLSLSLSVVLGFTQAPAATYYVSPKGNDSTGTGSQSQPFAGLSRACQVARTSGDLIQINSGTYSDNNACVLQPGVSIQGAGKDLVKITTSADTYIDGNSGTPVVSGNNEISGISLVGSGDNKGIYFGGRSGQKIHDCGFENFDRAIEVLGKAPTWKETCSSTPTTTAIYCDNDARMSTEPGSSDWATGIEISNNTLKNASIQAHTLKGAKIHHNVIDNATSLKGGFGYTAYWWQAVDFYANKITTQTNAYGTIALEVWMVEGNSLFHDNWTNGWFSIIKNPNGPKTPYSWQITNNVFESNAPRGIGSQANGCALETCYHVENVLVEGNTFINTGSNKTYLRAIAVWGYGINRNFTIRNNVMVNMAYDAIVIQATESAHQLFDGDQFYIYNNVFDTVNNGTSQGVALIDGPGDIDNVFIKNNIFITVDRGALVYPAGHSVSGVEFTNNVVYNGKGFTWDSGTGAFAKLSDNFTFNPEIQRSGARPDPYYRPLSAAANIVDKGIAVGDLSYTGMAPDIGAYEATLTLPAPQSLRISN